MSGLEDVPMSPPPLADTQLLAGAAAEEVDDDEFTLMEGVFDTPAEAFSEPVRLLRWPGRSGLQSGERTS